MSVLEAVALGVIQGVTEFLPISSDGHLALATLLLGRSPDLTFIVFLHGATVLAMYAYFWADVCRLLFALAPANRARATTDRRIILLVVAGTFATGLVALALEPVVEPMSGSAFWVGVWFCSTSLVLFVGEYFSRFVTRTPTVERLTVGRALFLGLMQGLAVLPGLSRSGSTISAGMLLGLTREDAARFSFTLGIPIITLAAARDYVSLTTGTASLPPLPVATAGFVAAALSGYFAISFLLRLLRSRTLYGFAIYTGVLGAILLVSSLI